MGCLFLYRYGILKMQESPHFNLKKDIGKKASVDIINLIDKKILFFHDVIQNTILHIQKNKIMDIVGISEVDNCVNNLYELSKKLKNITDQDIVTTTDNIINVLQTINHELSGLLKLFGTHSFDDFLWICFGNNSPNLYTISDMDKQKFELLKKYFHPINYRIYVPKTPEDSKVTYEDCALTEKSKNLDCVDVGINVKKFRLKISGIQMIIHNPQQKKSLIVTGTIDDIMIDILDNKFLNLKYTSIIDNIPNSPDFCSDAFDTYTKTLNIKDYLICEPHEIYLKYVSYLSNLNAISQKTIANVVKDFISVDLFTKRTILIQLLIKTDKYDNQYLAYLLYDLLTNDANNTIDTQDQITIFDSFPLIIKKYFKDAMNNTEQYTNDLCHFDMQKIPLEQQICLLKVNDGVKEKAMIKLKEVKSKSEDSGAKARQYLEGLLKIPFNIYKKEPILNVMNEIRDDYNRIIQLFDANREISSGYTNLQILKSLKEIKHQITTTQCDIQLIKSIVATKNRHALISYIENINVTIIEFELNIKLISHSNKSKSVLYQRICDFIDICPSNKLLTNIFDDMKFDDKKHILEPIKLIEDKYDTINQYMTTVKTTLDGAVHGHSSAKKQIERIIGQWINGKLDGYCFGFEGPPGVGKTSLAKKGLSTCLKDSEGISRPFAMIQMGGDANGSSLHGHNYTYVGSTWGSIVQILIDKRCMNPIIFIDEIDKISKTEHGKEIVGILTHLLDSTQNDCFQDKYFSGVDLDLSKALFILSYNDPDAIDKILLDRIHRVNFKHLTLDEKIVIAQSHILPDVYDKMGMTNMIEFSPEVLKFIINEYTCEPGVRKLKEILFEIIGEINLDILKNNTNHDIIPIQVTINDIKLTYFKDKQAYKHYKIHSEPKIGIINGLWANAMGKGGVIPIQSKWRPSKEFLNLHLTGMQGDVMKESMNVALTLAWNLATEDKRTNIIASQNKTSNGVHIHCPEGATPKDGPSAGTAITTTLYSLFNGLKIKNNIAITGEITLDGNVTEIGGLDLKILGGISAGIKEFIYPKDNQKDFDAFILKYGNDELTKDIVFSSVSTIDEVFQRVFHNPIQL